MVFEVGGKSVPANMATSGDCAVLPEHYAFAQSYRNVEKHNDVKRCQSLGKATCTDGIKWEVAGPSENDACKTDHK